MTDTPETETGTALALFPKLNLPSVAGIAEEMNKSFGTMYTRIEAGIAELPTDMSVAANRDKVRSYAYSISRTKTGLDDAAADVAGEAKTIVDTVNAERRQLKSTLDMLRDKARAPLDAWEAKIEAQEKATADKLEDFASELSTCRDQSSVFIADTMGEIAAEIYCEEVFGEAGAEQVEEERRITLQKMADMRTAKVRQEEEAAELEQLRREKAEREAREAEEAAEKQRKIDEENARLAEIAEQERIAKQVEERAAEVRRKNYELARFKLAKLIDGAGVPGVPSHVIAYFIEQAGEMTFTDETYPADKVQKLGGARDETVRKLQKMAADRQAEEKAEAEQKEAARIADEKRREAEAEEQRKEAAARAEEDAKRREAAAKEEERQRIERQQAEQKAAEEARAADIAHRRRINAAAAEAIQRIAEDDLKPEDLAKAIVLAIYKGQVPHVTISY